jgi:hypothetical protein
LLYLVTQIRTTVKSTVGWRPGDVREWLPEVVPGEQPHQGRDWPGVLEIRHREIRAAPGGRARRQVRAPRAKEGSKKSGLHPRAVRKSRVHPRRRCVDPKAQRGHDAFDHVEDRLLPLKQTVRPITSALNAPTRCAGLMGQLRTSRASDGFRWVRASSDEIVHPSGFNPYAANCPSRTRPSIEASAASAWDREISTAASIGVHRPCAHRVELVARVPAHRHGQTSARRARSREPSSGWPDVTARPPGQSITTCSIIPSSFSCQGRQADERLRARFSPRNAVVGEHRPERCGDR